MTPQRFDRYGKRFLLPEIPASALPTSLNPDCAPSAPPIRRKASACRRPSSNGVPRGIRPRRGAATREATTAVRLRPGSRGSRVVFASTTSASSTSSRANSASSRASSKSVCCPTGATKGCRQRWQTSGTAPSSRTVSVGRPNASCPPLICHAIGAASPPAANRSAARGRLRASMSPDSSALAADNSNASKRPCAPASVVRVAIWVGLSAGQTPVADDESPAAKPGPTAAGRTNVA